MAEMMRPRRRGSRKAAPPTEGAETQEAPAPVAEAPVAEAPVTAETAGAEAHAETAPEMAPETVEAPPMPEPIASVAARRFVINLNMLSNVDVKFYTEATSRQDAINHWRDAIGRAKRLQPETTVEVVMGTGDLATSYILYLAEVTAFAVGPSVDDSDAIDCVVNV